jgi:hypothetical protein
VAVRVFYFLGIHSGPESFSVCTQGLRPGLICVAPLGADVFAVVRLEAIEGGDGAAHPFAQNVSSPRTCVTVCKECHETEHG